MSETPKQPDQLSLTDAFIPRLTAGDYTLTAKQTLKGGGRFCTLARARQDFLARRNGPRFDKFSCAISAN